MTNNQHKEEVDKFLSNKSNKEAVKSYLQDWASKNSSLYKRYVTYADRNGSDIIYGQKIMRMIQPHIKLQKKMKKEQFSIL